MNYEQMLQERIGSPSSRLVRTTQGFDERDWRYATIYSVIYKREDGICFWHTITVRTLSQMDVE